MQSITAAGSSNPEEALYGSIRATGGSLDERGPQVAAKVPHVSIATLSSMPAEFELVVTMYKVGSLSRVRTNQLSVLESHQKLAGHCSSGTLLKAMVPKSAWD